MRALALILALGSFQEEPEEKSWKSFLGSAPPEISIPKEKWINVDEPVTIEKLKGKVVWLEFIGSVF